MQQREHYLLLSISFPGQPVTTILFKYMAHTANVATATAARSSRARSILRSLTTL
jgi:ABC-type Fe2+-enterobactin transport system substrate-binding protein